MARISNFPLDDNVGLNDILVGSEYNGIGANNRPIYVTKNYRIGDLSNFFGLNADTVAINANKLSSLATFNADGSLASLQNATISLINTATTGAGFATASSVTAVGSRVDVIMPGGGSTVSEAFANQVFTTTTNSDFAASSEVTEIKSQFTYNGDDINGLASGTIISTAIATAETSAVSTADTARATAETALVATISKVFRQTSAPAVTEPVNSIWYDTDDNNKPYVLVAGTPRVWTAVNDPTLATSASVTTVSDALALANGKLSARYGIKVATGNVFAGMELLSNSDATGAVSDIIFTATNFKIKTIDGSGNVSPVAPFTVSGANGSNVVSIDGTLKIGNTSLTDVTTKANSATQASDHSTIQAGTTAANVGLANVVNSNFDASGNVIGGAVGGTTINSTKIFQGTGTFGNANTGFYLDNGGNFSLRNKLVFNGNTGDLSIAGDISATSGTIADGVTIGGAAASTVASGAASGATANQTSTADIRAVGAATSGTIAGISISGSELYQGAGTFGAANTGFYLGSNGTFSLKDKLTWDGTTLTVNGGGTFSGNISAATGTFGGGVSGTGYTLNNSGLSLTNASSSISLGNSVVLNSSGLSGTGFALTSTGLVATSANITGAITATSGTFTGAISGGTISVPATSPLFSVTSAGALTASSGTVGGFLINTYRISSGGTDTWKTAGTGFYATNAGYFSLGNTFSHHGGSGALTIEGNATFKSNLDGASGSFSGEVQASSGNIGGWELSSTSLTSSSGEVDLDSNGYLTIYQGTTPRIEINKNTTVSNPASSAALSSIPINGATAGSTALSSSNTSVFINQGAIDIQTAISRNSVYYFYGNHSLMRTTTLQNSSASYSISMQTGGMAMATQFQFSGVIKASFGLAFSTTATSTPFAYSSAINKQATITSASSGSLTAGTNQITGSFTWPDQQDVYVRGYVKAVVVDGVSTPEAGTTNTTTTANVTPPKAVLQTNDILTAITKSEFTAGGLLIAKDSSSYFRINRNSDTNSDQFIRSRGHWGHFGNGGFKMYNDVNAYATQFVSKFTARETSASGYHIVCQGLVNGSNTNVVLVTTNGAFQSRANSYTATSDKKLKENIVDATSKLDEIKRVKIRNFNFIGDDLKQIGVIAQELESIWPGLVEDAEQPSVTDDESETTNVKIVKYSLFGPILVKAMQEQQAIIESQKTLIDNLTERVTALEG